MKRIGLLASLLLPLMLAPAAAPAAPSHALSTACQELPWETVDAVLKRVDALYAEYTYPQLVDGYQVGLLTVEYVDGVYRVTIYDEEGIDVIILIDSF